MHLQVLQSSTRPHAGAPPSRFAKFLFVFVSTLLLATSLASATDPLGATLHKDGTTTFRVWAPFVDNVGVKINDGAVTPMKQEPGHTDPADTTWVAGGCGAFRMIDARACEAKRLYVSSEFRGWGIGRLLLTELLTTAREAGYSEVYADTLPRMTRAPSLYASFGFQRTEPYSSHPTPGAIYLVLAL